MIQTLKIATKFSDRIMYLLIVVLWAVNVGVNLLTSNKLATQRYNIPENVLDLLTVVFSLPLLLIWLAVAFAAISFYRYAQNIAGSKDAKAFRFFSYGLAASLVGLIASSVLSASQTVIGQFVADPASLQTMFVVIRNYVSIVVALATYTCLFIGSTVLLEVIGKKLNQWRQILPVLVPFAGLALIYLWLLFTNDSRQVSTTLGYPPTFGLPDSLILLTVAIPYLLAWFLGITALRNIIQYQSQTPGIIYKKILKKLVTGMTIVISLSIILQLIAQFSGFWASKGLSTILWVATILFIVLIFAYVQIALGARQLHKIEIIGRDGER